MKLTRQITIGIAALLASLSLQLQAANWSLSSDKSSLHFVSIKKGSIGEVHHFKKLEGDINPAGQAEIKIALSSVETNIPIRNDRMQKMLFNTDKYSNALISVKTDINRVNALAIGGQYTQKVTAKLTLVGITKSVSAEVRITKLSSNRFSVNTVSPVLLNASEFDLVGGIQALQKIAGLPSIATSVPVTFSFLFENE